MQQTQTAVQQRKRNLQDLLLSKLRRSRMGATVFLVNGFQIRGEIRGFDAFVVVIYSEGKQQMVYKHAISTVVPERPLSSGGGSAAINPGRLPAGGPGTREERMYP